MGTQSDNIASTVTKLSPSDREAIIKCLRKQYVDNLTDLEIQQCYLDLLADAARITPGN